MVFYFVEKIVRISCVRRIEILPLRLRSGLKAFCAQNDGVALGMASIQFSIEHELRFLL